VRGQFDLQTRLPNETDVTGTTWYMNRIFPDRYWRLWSDYLVHAIHRRVLQHIKIESERAAPR
jgi:hypothetical protein